MSSTVVGALILTCTFGGALFGIYLRGRLPPSHLDRESSDTVKLVMGLIATLTALVLGLLISSAHSAYAAETAEIQQLGVHLYQIDRLLARFGPDAAQPRALLRKLVEGDIDLTWPSDQARVPGAAALQERLEGEQLFDQIASLSPTTNLQRLGQSRALQLLASVAETRRLLTEQAEGSLSWPFLLVVGAWLTLLFFGFGLFARFNPTVVIALFAGAISVAAATILILEMYHPFRGWMQVSSAPLREALNQISQMNQMSE